MCGAEEQCGETLLLQTFDQYPGRPQNYTFDMIRADFPRSEEKRRTSTNEEKFGGLAFSKGHGRGYVGDGMLRNAHPQGALHPPCQQGMHCRLARRSMTLLALVQHLQCACYDTHRERAFLAGCVQDNESGFQFDVRLEKPVMSATVSYYVKFSNNFDFTYGGKLPGLCGECALALRLCPVDATEALYVSRIATWLGT